MEWKDIIGKTIESIEPKKEDKYNIDSLIINFTDKTSIIILGGKEDYRYNGEYEERIEYVSMEIYDNNNN
jgi:hypothetical protein